MVKGEVGVQGSGGWCFGGKVLGKERKGGFGPGAHTSSHSSIRASTSRMAVPSASV